MSQARYKPFGPLLSKSMIVKRSNSQSGAFSAQGMSTGIMTPCIFFRFINEGFKSKLPIQIN